MTRPLLWHAWALLLIISWIMFAVIVWAATQVFLGAAVLLNIIERGLGG